MLKSNALEAMQTYKQKANIATSRGGNEWLFKNAMEGRGRGGGGANDITIYAISISLHVLVSAVISDKTRAPSDSANRQHWWWCG